jgi:hypothetical protein
MYNYGENDLASHVHRSSFELKLLATACANPKDAHAKLPNREFLGEAAALTGAL